MSEQPRIILSVITVLKTTVIVLITLTVSRPALSKVPQDAEQLARTCSASLKSELQGADLGTCKRSNEIALPLARAARDRGFGALLNGKPAQAENEFSLAGNYWATMHINFLWMAFASGGNTTKLGISLQREGHGANMFFAESCIGRARAALSLGKIDNALSLLHVALEHNQDPLNWFKEFEPSSPAMGRSLYQRGLIKFLLAELGSARGSKKEACEAMQKSAAIGFSAAESWLKTERGKTCPT